MPSWILVPCLVSLREEFNRLAPARDNASDGSIGDVAHQQESSDHNPDETGKTPSEDADSVNEVHAIDVDSDLRKPGWTMQRCVDIIVARHRTGLDDRLQNVIYNRRIWSRSWGWTARAYSGPSPHTEHAHFSARYTTAQEADTRPWGLLEEDTMTPDDAKAVAAATQNLEVGRSGLTLGAMLQSTLTAVQALVVLAKAEAAEVPPSVQQIVDGVEAAFGTGSPADTAAALKAVLGSKAQEVGRLLAAS